MNKINFKGSVMLNPTPVVLVTSINKDGTVDEAIHNNIDLVVKEISEDEAIKLLIDQGKVKVVGAYYDLDGKVTFY